MTSQVIRAKENCSGLGAVTFTAHPAGGPITVEFLSAGARISDPNFEPIAFEFPQDPIGIKGGGDPVIPEPSSWILACVGLAGLVSARAWKLNRGAVSG